MLLASLRLSDVVLTLWTCEMGGTSIPALSQQGFPGWSGYTCKPQLARCVDEWIPVAE